MSPVIGARLAHDERMTRFVVVALDRQEARVWTSGVAPGAKPELIHAPNHRAEHRHVREGQMNHGQNTANDESQFFERIAGALSGAGEILLIGHGNGKANTPQALHDYLNRKHHDLSTKVAGSVDGDLSALSEAQILAMARHWFDAHDRP